MPYAGFMNREPENLKMTHEGIREFVGYYAERVKLDQQLPDLEWVVDDEDQYVELWLKSENFQEPLKVPLNICRATQPLEDLEGIRKRIYTSFSTAARQLANRRSMGAP